MTLFYPSEEFDHAVAAVCHGLATEADMAALNVLLRTNPSARDEYLWRVELHTRLASHPDLFCQAASASTSCELPGISMGEQGKILPLSARRADKSRNRMRVLALAACLMLIAGVASTLWFTRSAARNGATSSAVAMLARAVDARWAEGSAPMGIGRALEPGWLRLEAGLAQVVFYSGARVVMEGPTDLQLVSPTEAICTSGKLLAEVPQPARGFHLKTAQIDVVDHGTAFGIDAKSGQTTVHVFKGEVEFFARTVAKQSLGEGNAVVVQGGDPPHLMAASRDAFASMSELQMRSLASEAFRYEQWQFASARINQDPSLVVHLDFENSGDSDWTLRNTAQRNQSVSEATIVGCQRAEGRWREKQALEFQSVNDRVRLAVPGEFQELTLSAWVCVKGLDRQFNSLFMSDGFDPGTIHWLIRNDGVLGLTVFGASFGKFQILASPPVITLDRLGMWIHLAVALDGRNQRVIHYLNGSPVSDERLRLGPPFRIGSAELGNWNAPEGGRTAPALIRNLSGSLDEFELFNRALSEAEIRELYEKGKPHQ